MCRQHRSEELRLYCHFCKTVICFVCFCESHTKHRHSYVETAGEELLTLIDNSVALVSDRITRHSQRRQEIQDEYQRFLDSAAEIEQTVRDSEKRMKATLENNFQSLLDKLGDLKQTKKTEVENATQKLDEQLNEMAEFKDEAEDCRDNGSVLDVAINGTRLAARAEELNKLKVNQQTQKLCFLPSVPKAEWAGKGCKNVIGEIIVHKNSSGLLSLFMYLNKSDRIESDKMFYCWSSNTS